MDVPAAGEVEGEVKLFLFPHSCLPWPRAVAINGLGVVFFSLDASRNWPSVFDVSKLAEGAPALKNLDIS
jgi:hypothetical protein